VVAVAEEVLIADAERDDMAVEIIEALSLYTESGLPAPQYSKALLEQSM
jgi:hypothetical protein